MKPVLSTWSNRSLLWQERNAAAMKLVGNLIVALEMEALAEGLVLAQKAGLDLKTVMEVVKAPTSLTSS